MHNKKEKEKTKAQKEKIKRNRCASPYKSFLRKQILLQSVNFVLMEDEQSKTVIINIAMGD